MNLIHPRIATAAAFLIAVEAAVPVFVARSAAPSTSSAPRVVQRDPFPEDLDSLAKRSRLGDPCATFEYARRIEFGLGTRRDAALAAYWYQVAEEQGYELPQDVIERLFP